MNKRLTVAVAALTLPLLLSACKPGQAGAAAFVGQARLSESQVQADTKETLQAMGGAAPENTDSGTIMDRNVERFIHHELLVAAAAREGITVSQGEIATLISQTVGTSGLAELQQEAAQQASIPPSALNQYAGDVLLERKLTAKLAPGQSQAQQEQVLQAYFVKLGKELGVTVSPRYGVWDPANLQLLPVVNDLSLPAGSAVPGASPESSSSSSPGTSNPAPSTPAASPAAS
ncbi:MAG TPA: hypothetical protein VMI11_13320 [Actinomycetes bacterium]|nr:hypothetical protein [Actinomycetes bacterium]